MTLCQPTVFHKNTVLVDGYYYGFRLLFYVAEMQNAHELDAYIV